METTTKKIRSIFIWGAKMNTVTMTTIEHQNTLINRHDLFQSVQDGCYWNCQDSKSTNNDKNQFSVTNLQKRKKAFSVLEVRSASQEEECVIESAALLLQACAAGDVKTVRNMRNSQMSLNIIRTKHGATVLHLAARNGHVQVLRMLLDGFAEGSAKDTKELVEECDDDGQTALHWAASSGPAFACSLDCSSSHIQVVSFLVLQAHAHVNARSAHGTTPLDHAVRGGHLAVARLLSAHGAQLGADLDNGTALIKSTDERIDEDETVSPDLDKPITGIVTDLLMEEADDEDTATNISTSTRNSVESFGLSKLDSAIEGYKPVANITDEVTFQGEMFDQQTFSMMEGLIPMLNGAGKQKHIKEVSSQIINIGHQINLQPSDVLKIQDQQPNSPTERPNNEIAQIGGSSAAFVSGPIRPWRIFTLLFLIVLAMAIVVTTSDSGHNLMHFLIRSEGQQPSPERIQQSHSEVIKSTNHSGNLATNQTIIKENISRSGAFVSNFNNADLRASKEPLFTTICEDRTKDVPKLLNAGADLHALHCAAKFGHSDTVKLLMERGANANMQDENGRTPLHYAVSENHAKTVLMLLHFGGLDSQTIQDNEGHTPAELALHARSLQALQVFLTNWGAIGRRIPPVDINFLLEKAEKYATKNSMHGAEVVDFLQKFRSTSLHLAIKANRIVEVAELLRHYGKDIVNIKNDHNGTGNTPLHEAMLVNNPEMVHMLLDNGADVSIVNNAGHSAQKIANESNHQIAKLVQSKDQIPLIKDQFWRIWGGIDQKWLKFVDLYKNIWFLNQKNDANNKNFDHSTTKQRPFNKQIVNNPAVKNSANDKMPILQPNNNPSQLQQTTQSNMLHSIAQPFLDTTMAIVEGIWAGLETTDSMPQLQQHEDNDCAPNSAPFATDSAPCAPNSAPFAEDSTPLAADSALCTVDSAPCPVDSSPCATDSAPCSVDSAHSAIDSVFHATDYAPYSIPKCKRQKQHGKGHKTESNRRKEAARTDRKLLKMHTMKFEELCSNNHSIADGNKENAEKRIRGCCEKMRREAERKYRHLDEKLKIGQFLEHRVGKRTKKNSRHLPKKCEQFKEKLKKRVNKNRARRQNRKK